MSPALPDRVPPNSASAVSRVAAKREVILKIGELLDELADVKITPVPKIGRGRTFIGNFARDNEEPAPIAPRSGKDYDCEPVELIIVEPLDIPSF